MSKRVSGSVGERRRAVQRKAVGLALDLGRVTQELKEAREELTRLTVLVAELKKKLEERDEITRSKAD